MNKVRWWSSASVVVAMWLFGAAPAVAGGLPPTATFSDAGLSGWTATTDCTGLCSTTTRFDAGTSAAMAEFSTLLGMSGLTTGTATFTSPNFTWSGPTPTSAAVSFRTRATFANQVGGTATLRLLDTTAGTSSPVAASGALATSGSFSTVSSSVPVASFVAGHVYQLQLVAAFSTGLAALATSSIRVDDVSITAVDATAPLVGGSVARAGTDQGSLVVEALIGAGGAETSWSLEWGTTAALGRTVSGGTIAASDAHTASATFSGLTAATTIYWRFVAQNAVGSSAGAVGSAQAPNPLPKSSTATGAGASGDGGVGVGVTSTSTQQGATAGAGRKAATGERCTIVGTKAAERFVGTFGRDVICGMGGNDVIDGRAGNDVIDGGAGNDRLLGGAGNDRLLGGAGNDRLLGGSGNDRLSGGGGNDLLWGSTGLDRLMGGAGTDRFAPSFGRDTLLDHRRGERIA